MERIQEGYRAYTGYVFTKEQAAAYNAACERAERSPSEANINGAHNLFNSIAMTPRYKIVSNGKSHYYATLEAAKAVASQIFDKTGILVGIEAA